MSAQVSYKKQFTFFFMLFCVLLIIIEIYLQVVPVNYDCEFSSHVIFDKFSQTEKNLMCKEYSSIIYDQSTPIKLLNPQQGEYVNINSDGFRGASLDFKSDSYRIFILGGSSLFGHVSSSDETTIPALLEKKIQVLKLDIKIINAGIPYSTTIDERYYIEHHILDYDPDLIIMYDGWNDIWHINETKSNVSYEELSLNNAVLNNQQYTKSILYKISREGFYLFESINYKTGLGVTHILHDVVEPNILGNTMDNSNYNLEISNENLLKFENNMITNWSEVCKLGELNGFQTVNIIQPILGTSNKNLNIDDPLESNYLKSIDMERISSASSCDNIVDLRDVFSGIDEKQIYFDRGHMSDLGNEIIAEKLFELISPMLLEK